VSASKEALTSASTATEFLVTDSNSKITPPMFMCDWCGREERTIGGLCSKCSIIATHAWMLAREVALLTQKGGCQLYIAIERTGERNELLSVKRWSPLEPLESADSVSSLSDTSL
jgi:hypothetical protein